ncbi:uncharacterized protein LOC134704945 [Mytilus trossulus]|uniref:uncharacterized protein LOC134704945 n=1 Tax=Mytilus trossulus TaxID=6551 RepID=UPI003007E982
MIMDITGKSNIETIQWWEHWSVSGSMFIAAVTLGRDFSREIGEVQHSSVFWYLLESLLLVYTCIAVARKVQERFSNRIFDELEVSTEFDKIADDSKKDHQEPPKKISVGTQTDHKDYDDLTERLKSNHHSKLAKINKDIRQFRQLFTSKISKVRKSTKEVSKKMCDIQLKIPALTQENKFLSDEKDTLHAKIVEETALEQDINEKFFSLHAYVQYQGQTALTEPAELIH